MCQNYSRWRIHLPTHWHLWKGKWTTTTEPNCRAKKNAIKFSLLLVPLSLICTSTSYITINVVRAKIAFDDIICSVKQKWHCSQIVLPHDTMGQNFISEFVLLFFLFMWDFHNTVELGIKNNFGQPNFWFLKSSLFLFWRWFST